MKDALRHSSPLDPIVTKQSHPNCFAVAYCGSSYFIYHAFKVKEDREFILQLIAKKDIRNLNYMEDFYRTLRNDQACKEDIYARNSLKLLPLSAAQGMEESSYREDTKEIEEIKIKRPKKRTL